MNLVDRLTKIPKGDAAREEKLPKWATGQYEGSKSHHIGLTALGLVIGFYLSYIDYKKNPETWGDIIPPSYQTHTEGNH